MEGIAAIFYCRERGALVSRAVLMGVVSWFIFDSLNSHGISSIIKEASCHSFTVHRMDWLPMKTKGVVKYRTAEVSPNAL